MAEKRVSVRLGAKGGDQVKSDLKGVGDAGERGFGRLSRETEMASARLERFASRAKLAAAAAGAAVAAAAGAMIRNGLETIDNQAKVADSLGTTVESLQVLERAAQVAGVEVGEISSSSGALAELTLRLSEAAAGGGPAADALRRLGLSAEELLGLSMDKRVARINEAIQEFVPAAQRAAVAGELFGEEGALAISRLDTDTIRRAARDVRDFGLGVSEIEADAVERANEAISRLGLVWQGVSNRLTTQLAPSLEIAAQSLGEIAREVVPAAARALALLAENIDRIVGAAAALAALMAARFVGALGAAVVSVRTLSAAFVALKWNIARTGIGLVVVALGALGTELLMAANEADKLGQATDNAVNALGDEIQQSQLLSQVLATSTGMSVDAARKKLEEARSRNENVKAIIAEQRALALGSDAYARLSAEIADARNQLKSTGFPSIDAAVPGREAAFEAAQKRLAGLLQERQKLLESDEALSDQLAETEANIARLETALANASNGVVRFGNDLIEPIKTGDRLDKVLGRIGATTAPDVAGGLDSVNQAAEATSRTMDRVRTGMASAFTSIVTGSQSAEDAISRLLGSMADLLANRAFNQIFDAVFGGGSGGGGGIFGKLVGSALSAAVGAGMFGDLTADPTPGLFGRAAGGPVQGGRPYWINEHLHGGRRVEMFVPSESGGVLNVPQAQAALRNSAGDGATVIVNNYGASVSTDRGPDGETIINVAVERSLSAMRGEIRSPGSGADYALRARGTPRRTFT